MAPVIRTRPWHMFRGCAVFERVSFPRLRLCRIRKRGQSAHPGLVYIQHDRAHADRGGFHPGQARNVCHQSAGSSGDGGSHQHHHLDHSFQPAGDPYWPKSPAAHPAIRLCRPLAPLTAATFYAPESTTFCPAPRILIGAPSPQQDPQNNWWVFSQFNNGLGPERHLRG